MTADALTARHVPSQGTKAEANPDVAPTLIRNVRNRLREQVRVEEAAIDGHIDKRRRDEIAEAFLGEELEAYARSELAAGRPLPDAESERSWAKEARNHLFGLGGLQPYLDMPDVENINTHGCDKIFLRLSGNRRARGEWPVARSDKELIELIREIAAHSGEEERLFSRRSPLLDLQLPDGSRLNASGWVVDRPSLSIRIHRFPTATMATMVELGVMDPDLAAFLAAAVKARMNILVSGGPETGKTTLLRALASEIPLWESLVTIEDSRELNLGADPEQHPDVKSFQARLDNIEGEGAVSLADLARNALRMAPDRVIVGEVRGEEILPMFAAMSQGSDGSMATIHASSSRQALMRIAAYAAKGPEGLRLEEANLYAASAIDLIVQLDYTDDLTTRVVASIREIVDADGSQLITNEVYRPDPAGRAEPTGALTAARAKRLEAAGLDRRILVARNPW
ncbi:CpaF family protein [Catenulispora sp. NL8]|uniref:CpaF family protein n=1 Tax=Catenulispora pinistramenti TaxID=2705254 RepID=A0ABS5KGF8_9ACTN|nr:ATPase, T2SS/T4P/T4SS family [Catenulispora pinistramenti]MBS2545356.1 CpaF family protein [Catenulispora pinistramenti]